jgi:hypothetical protein
MVVVHKKSSTSCTAMVLYKNNDENDDVPEESQRENLIYLFRRLPDPYFRYFFFLRGIVRIHSELRGRTRTHTQTDRVRHDMPLLYMTRM